MRIEPIELSEPKRLDLANWLYDELINTMAQRKPLEEKWVDYLHQWRAALPIGTKEHPWPGASNLEFPLTAIHSDPVYADFLQTLHAAPDYWNVVANRPDRVDYANPMTKLMTAVERNYLNMRCVNERALLDNNILGTAIYKSHWFKEAKKVQDYDIHGVIVDTIRSTSKPIIEHIPLQHFYIPPDAWSLDPDAPVGAARWMGQRVFITPAQLRVRSGDPIAPYNKEAVEKVLLFEQESGDNIDREIQEQQLFKPWKERKLSIFEIWARYDVDGDGIESDIQVIWHQETATILRAIHNPFIHKKPPFHRTRYLPTFGFYGMGIAEVDEWAQLTSTKLLNAQIDNVAIANTRMYSAPLGAAVPGEEIYPGKIWLVGPNEEIGEVRLGEVYPSMGQLQTQIMQLAEMRTGVSELRQGNLTGLPSRTPATSLLSILREGNKRFDMILAGVRDTHSEMGLRILQNLSQAYHEDPTQWQQFCTTAIGDIEAAKVLEVLNGPVMDIPDAFGVTVTATSAQVNKEVEKQSLIGLMQIMTQIYQGLVQTAMLLQQMPPGSLPYMTASAAYAGGVEMMSRILERFDIHNPDEYIPNLQAIAGAMTASATGQNAAMTSMAPGAGLMPPSEVLGQGQLGSILGL